MTHKLIIGFASAAAAVGFAVFAAPTASAGELDDDTFGDDSACLGDVPCIPWPDEEGPSLGLTFCPDSSWEPGYQPCPISEVGPY